jgi:hypothetical protein
MSIIRTSILASVAALAVAGTASASVTIVPGTAGDIPSAGEVNDVLFPLFGVNSLGGFFGAQIENGSGGQGGQFLYTYLGKEASYRNYLFVDNVQVFQTSPTAVASAPGDTAIGTLDFFIRSIKVEMNVPSLVGETHNGSNPGNGAPEVVNFFASCGPGLEDQTTCDVVYIFLDDTGANDDDNHDDMVFSIEMAPIPLPAGILLLGTALGGLGFARRFRKS